MRKQLSLVVIAAAALLFAGAACSKKIATTTNTATNSLVNSSVNTAPSANVNGAANTNAAATNATTSAKTVAVSATSSSFSPGSVTINAGDTVKWTNNGSTTLYVAPDNHPSHTKYAGLWDDDGTVSMSAGASYSKTFTTPGTYTYHDHNNALVTGTVIVQ